MSRCSRVDRKLRGVLNSQSRRAGFQIVGIVPASDRLMVAPGVIKRVYEAIYVKVLAADADVLRPQSQSMTPRTKALYDFLFAG